MFWKILELLVSLFVWSRRSAVEVALPPHTIDAVLEAESRTLQAKERAGWVILRKSVKEDIKSCIHALKGNKVRGFTVNHATGEVKVAVEGDVGLRDISFYKTEVLVHSAANVKLHIKEALTWFFVYPKAFKVWSVPVLQVDAARLAEVLDPEDPFKTVF